MPIFPNRKYPYPELTDWQPIGYGNNQGVWRNVSVYEGEHVLYGSGRQGLFSHSDQPAVAFCPTRLSRRVSGLRSSCHGRERW